MQKPIKQCVFNIKSRLYKFNQWLQYYIIKMLKRKPQLSYSKPTAKHEHWNSITKYEQQRFVQNKKNSSVRHLRENYQQKQKQTLRKQRTKFRQNQRNSPIRPLMQIRNNEQFYMSWTDKKVNQIKKKYNVNVSQSLNCAEWKHKKCNSTYDQRNYYQAKANYQQHSSSLHKKQGILNYQDQNYQKQKQKIKVNYQKSHLAPQNGLKVKAKVKDCQNLQQNQIQKIKSKLYRQSTKPYTTNLQKTLQFDRLPLKQFAYSGNFDPRIQSINKINAKIKLMLNYIDNVDTKFIVQKQNKSKQTTKAPFQNIIKNSVISQNLHYPSRALKTQNPGEFSPIKQLPIPKRIRENQQKINNFFNKNNCENRKAKDYQSLLQKHQQNQPRNMSQNHFYLRKHSNERCKTDINIKQVEDKISEIGNKIIVLQSEKKKLNIEFQPFRYNSRNKKQERCRTQISPQKHQRLSQIRNKYTKNSLLFKDKNIKQLKLLRQSRWQDKNRIFSVQKKIGNSKKLQQIDIQQQKSEDYQIQQEVKHLKNQKTTSLFVQENTTSMNQRRKRLIQYKQKLQNKQQILDFRVKLKQQISLDQKFKEAKHWFSQLTSNDKWIQLKMQLNKRHIYCDDAKNKFTYNQDEYDPFLSERTVNQTLSNMIQCYLNAELHWQNILKQTNYRKLLIQQDFVNLIDLKGKGYFTLQDIARFMNFQQDRCGTKNNQSFYRNRDVSTLFKRLIVKDQKSSVVDIHQIKVSSSDMLSIFSRQNDNFHTP